MRLKVGEVHFSSRVMGYSMGFTLQTDEGKLEGMVVIEVTENSEHPSKGYDIVSVSPKELVSQVIAYKGVFLDAVIEIHEELAP